MDLVYADLETTMKKVFTGKNPKNLVHGAAILLITGLIITNSFTSTLPSFADRATYSSFAFSKQSYFAKTFSTYCQFYYQDEHDSDTVQNIADCQKLSPPFNTFLARFIAKTNAKLWPSQESLDNLATSNRLGSIKTEPSFETAVKAISNQPLQDLIAGDPDFLPTLWDYNSTDDKLITNGPNIKGVDVNSLIKKFCDGENLANSADVQSCNNLDTSLSLYLFVKPSSSIAACHSINAIKQAWIGGTTLNQLGSDAGVSESKWKNAVERRAENIDPSMQDFFGTYPNLLDDLWNLDPTTLDTTTTSGGSIKLSDVVAAFCTQEQTNGVIDNTQTCDLLTDPLQQSFSILESSSTRNFKSDDDFLNQWVNVGFPLSSLGVSKSDWENQLEQQGTINGDLLALLHNNNNQLEEDLWQLDASTLNLAKG